MNDLGYQNVEKEIKNVMKTIYLVEDNEINYTDFISATLDSKIYLNNEKLWSAFKHFDTDSTNFITANNIKEAMARAGRKLPQNELDEMVKEVKSLIN